ncbi:P-loop containing nucleoside triphosphate hydrolase protein [Mycena sp. CBHHK59/15]|nr:P-loop containing nucleoside triphosphate hydrolase protein [Mycena sp. CBHHK59/15]
MTGEESQLEDTTVNESDEPESNLDQIVDSFSGMELKPELLRGIYADGFERPSTIQQRAIVPVLKGRDVVAQSQAGTGKTVALSISILQRLDPAVKETQVLVLAPTRDVARRNHDLVGALAAYMGIQSMVLLGGTSVRVEIAALTEGVQLVILCLDEADDIVSRGFQEQIYELFERLPRATQVAIFSATLPAEVLDVAENLTGDPS